MQLKSNAPSYYPWLVHIGQWSVLLLLGPVVESRPEPKPQPQPEPFPFFWNPNPMFGEPCPEGMYGGFYPHCFDPQVVGPDWKGPGLAGFCTYEQ